MLWADKHKPTCLDDIKIHPFICKTLKRLSESQNTPHIMLYGPSGAGKATLIRSFLIELFGHGATKVKTVTKQLKISPSKNLEFKALSSIYHLELNPSLYGQNDRHIIQETLKEVASNKNLSTMTKRNFKVIVIDEADNLSETAQHSLRRTMEKYSAECRLFLVCENINKLIDPLLSRCLCLRVPAASNKDITSVLVDISQKEEIDTPDDKISTLVERSGRNLRKAIFALEFFHLCRQTPELGKVEPGETGWELFVKELSLLICEEQSAKRLLAVRSKLYELLSKQIPASLILKELAKNLLEKCDFSLQKEVIREAAFHEKRMCAGSKKIYHLEAFVAKFMSLFQKWSADYF